MSSVRRLTCVVLLAVAVVVCEPPSGRAHYKDSNSRWTFAGATYRTDEVRPSGISDPVNVFWYPHAWVFEQDGLGFSDRRIQTHLQAHWRPRWRDDDSMTDGPGPLKECKNNQFMFFTPTRSAQPNDTQGVGFTPGNQDIIPDDCGNRFHTRLWSDSNVHSPGTSHEPADRWFVGNMHHERIKLKFLSNPQSPFGADFKGHTIAKGWEEVEFTIVKMMRRPPKSSGHLDWRGEPGGHCTKKDWRRLPGSIGKKKFQNKFSNGKISRISLTHKSNC